MTGLFGVWFGLILASGLMAYAFGWALLQRHYPDSSARRAFDTVSRLPALFWLIAALAAFVLPLIAYWSSAHSHGNALAGLIPWNDAGLYYGCAQDILLGTSESGCGMRPFYVVMLAGLFWLAGNDMQIALLLQTILAGLSVFIYARVAGRYLSAAGTLAAFTVLALFAAMFCTGIMLTENAGLMLGVLAVALLWRSGGEIGPASFFLAMVLFAAGLNARGGAMFALPGLIFWAYFHAEGERMRRLLIAMSGIAGAGAGFAVAFLPTVILHGSLEATHSNFAYVLYAVSTASDTYLQALRDHPELLSFPGGEIALTQRITQLAIENILSRPHLFALGYLQGLGDYFQDLFRFVQDPLYGAKHFLGTRALMMALWLVGVLVAVANRRNSRYAMLLWLQAGILVSSPFLSFFGGNRTFATTMGIDALFVGLGMTWAARGVVAPVYSGESKALWRPVLPVAAVLILFLPVASATFAYGSAPASGYREPRCKEGMSGVIIQPYGRSIVLPLVSPGEEQIYPLKVRYDDFAKYTDKSVYSPNHVSLPAGAILYYGVRLDEGAFGATTRFIWWGEELPRGEAVAVCLEPPRSKQDKFMTGHEIQPAVVAP